jgi:hypothetical protein
MLLVNKRKTNFMFCTDCSLYIHDELMDFIDVENLLGGVMGVIDMNTSGFSKNFQIN